LRFAPFGLRPAFDFFHIIAFYSFFDVSLHTFFMQDAEDSAAVHETERQVEPIYSGK
jgi:hypothetical protein